jgi:hypothetical protein
MGWIWKPLWRFLVRAWGWTWLRRHEILKGAAITIILLSIIVAALGFAHSWAPQKTEPTIQAAEQSDGLNAGRCFASIAKSQFPKWVGCAMAAHENLAGGLIGSAGALLAAWIAWHAVMAQMESDRRLARNSERPIVHGGPGWRMKDPNDRHRDTGIVFTAQNTGKTAAFTKEIYWGVCSEAEWSTVGKNWPLVEKANHKQWEEVLPPEMTRDNLIGVEFTYTPIPDGETHVCYGTIVYVDLYGKETRTSWKHRVVREGKFLKTSALAGGYSSEWKEPDDQ